MRRTIQEVYQKHMSWGDWVGTDYCLSFPVSTVDKRSMKANRKVHSEKAKRGGMSGDWAVDLSAHRTGSEAGKAEKLFEGH